ISWLGGVPAGEFFFFQAEDGIRDFHVTGVQTCALPILHQQQPMQSHGFQGPGGGTDIAWVGGAHQHDTYVVGIHPEKPAASDPVRRAGSNGSKPRRLWFVVPDPYYRNRLAGMLSRPWRNRPWAWTRKRSLRTHSLLSDN